MATEESRLDRLEALAETTLLVVRENSQLARENSQAVADLRETDVQQGQELRDSIVQQGRELRENTAQQWQETRAGIDDLVQMMGELAQHHEEIRQRTVENDQRFNNLLEDARADRQHIDQALANADRDRAINEMEHRAFRETFQTLLAEIARIWQRLAG
ncbi:MAG: hypothetical protein ACFB0C_08690 [Leptolyngbyaceae cyanobacterium]